MINVEKKGKTDEYVYDISLDGTVVNALGMNIVSNTDGFNFQMPDDQQFRYTDEHPYISKGLGRNYPKGKAFTKVEGDVAEFEDMYMNEKYCLGINKMGLGIDEYVPCSINFSRKNYADLLDEETGEIKLVGNTIKSKKMPIYIDKFLDKGIRLLLANRGKDFLESYYDYIEKIYNMQIPLKEIASVGKIKTSIDEYKRKCKEVTKSGAKKARQAWYELAIKDNLNVHMGDSIYYINTGNKRDVSDVQRITKYYYINADGKKIDYVTDENGKPMLDKKGNRVDIAKKMNGDYAKAFRGVSNKPTKMEYARRFYPNLQDEDVLIFNCVRVPNSIIEDEDDHFCEDSDIEYNRDKYIKAFNNKVKPLLVCFDESIRYAYDKKGGRINNILITCPKDRKTFSEEECKLVSGKPYKPSDQDTYKQLMTMEDKEIRFWMSVNKKPLFCDEIGMDWDKIQEEYLERMEKLKQEGIRDEYKKYQEIIAKMTEADIDAVMEEGVLPDALYELVEENVEDNSFVSKKYGVKFGDISDIIDKFGHEYDGGR